MDNQQCLKRLKIHLKQHEINLNAIFFHRLYMSSNMKQLF